VRKFLKVDRRNRINLSRVDVIDFFEYEGDKENIYEVSFLRRTGGESITIYKISFDSRDDFERFQLRFDGEYTVELDV
jgi:hypothetical protein